MTLPIRLRIGDIEEFVEQHTKDLSEGGIFICMNYPPPEGSRVELEFHLDPVNKTIHAAGEVVRSYPETKGDSEPAGMAIRFTDLGDDGQKFIELVVQKFNRHHPSQFIEIPEGFIEEVDRELRVSHD